MSYVTESDLNRFLTTDQISTVERTEQDTGIIAAELQAAEDYVKERLGYKFDMDTELAKTGEDRSTILIEIIAIIAAYKLTIPFDMLDPESKYFEHYTRVSDMLDKIEAGDLLSDYLTFNDTTERTILYGKIDDTSFNY